MTYQETTDYLFNRVPMFQNIGKAGYKEGLDTTIALDKHFGSPHTKFKTIHIGGTNGKGSCSHTIAAILQSAGYKVGLFTSPHLIDFRERIRINGEMISEDYVTQFVEEEKPFFEPLQPSFFELTTAMAFKYFAEQEVDIAVIEVGLGGRLDCTNIITPILSVITNISFDHVQFLGNTLSAIASEKAGIIKHGIPAVIGETTEETKVVFQNKGNEADTNITFAEQSNEVLNYSINNGGIDYTTTYGNIHGELGGLCQIKNTRTILSAISELRKSGLTLSNQNVIDGFANVCNLTGLMGRWQKINNSPITYCDTGHNKGGLEYIINQLTTQSCKTLRIVFGMVNDKDINGVLSIMPRNAVYYFCKANVRRAMDSHELQDMAKKHQLYGEAYANVEEAYNAAIAESDPEDFVYIGGSSFVVADLLSFLTSQTD